MQTTSQITVGTVLKKGSYVITVFGLLIDLLTLHIQRCNTVQRDQHVIAQHTCWDGVTERHGGIASKSARRSHLIMKKQVFIKLFIKFSEKPYLIWEVIKLFLLVFSRPEGFCLTRAILAHFKILSCHRE